MSLNILKDLLIKTRSIIKGWFRFMFMKRSPMAQARLNVCFDCPFNKYWICTKCGCPLFAKAESEEEHCPHPENDLWKITNV